MYIKIHINVYIYIHNRHRVLFNTNVSTCHYFSRLPKSALGRDYALHPLPQGRDLGVSPCGGMGGEESLAGLPGDPVARRSTGSFHGDFHVFFGHCPDMTKRLLWKNQPCMIYIVIWLNMVIFRSYMKLPEDPEVSRGKFNVLQ